MGWPLRTPVAGILSIREPALPTVWSDFLLEWLVELLSIALHQELPVPPDPAQPQGFAGRKPAQRAVIFHGCDPSAVLISALQPNTSSLRVWLLAWTVPVF